MAERSSQPQLLELSADYSDDELDAIAELFDRVRLRGRRAAADGDERTRRAVADAALRALVARRALVLEGGPARPRVRFLEPHASLLDPFVAPDATVAIRVERPGRAIARALFLRGSAAVAQEALPAQAISRMTLRPRAVVLEQLTAGVPEMSAQAAETGAKPVELTPSMLKGAERAIAGDAPMPACVPAAAADVLYARTSTVTIEMTCRTDDGSVLVERRTWIDAGTAGAWELVAGEGEPPATLLLVAREPEARDAWIESLASELSQ